MAGQACGYADQFVAQGGGHGLAIADAVTDKRGVGAGAGAGGGGELV